jgi:enamine deaminase RidA (YjgF/YER057c/UK114 family)
MARQAIETRLAPASPSYSQAVLAGNLVFVSGTALSSPADRVKFRPGNRWASR